MMTQFMNKILVFQTWGIGDMIIPFVMDEIESADINTPLDFEFAEMIIRRKDGN